MKEVIASFGEKMRQEAEKAEKRVASDLDEYYKRAIKEIKDALDRVKETHRVTKGDEELLRRNFVPYGVTGNSSFVFRTMKKCFDRGICCRSLESFLASLPQSEMLDTVSEMKECLLSFCNYNLYSLLFYIFIFSLSCHIPIIPSSSFFFCRHPRKIRTPPQLRRGQNTRGAFCHPGKDP